MALDRADWDRLDAKFSAISDKIENGKAETHKRISDFREEFASHVATPCPDVLELKKELRVADRRGTDVLSKVLTIIISVLSLAVAVWAITK